MNPPFLKEIQGRRDFLKKLLVQGTVLVIGSKATGIPLSSQKKETLLATVHRALNGNPEQNLIRVINDIGGIEKVMGADDIVVIKPNVQWWNQGGPNLMCLKTFVDLVMDFPGGFNGEVVIAENNHRGSSPWDHAGWAYRFERNSNIENINNMNDLSALLKKSYGDRFSVCHWVDVDAVNKRVFGPENGTGYVYCDGTGGVPLISYDNGMQGEDYRAVIMSYPIFKTDKGTIVDFKNGVWEKGAYTDQPLKFINFPALNHHSTYCGATSAVKNYLGISDLSGGADPSNNGRLTGSYYNFHSFPFNEWAPGPKPGMLGAEIGVFMNTIRKADLNITTAEWVGLSSRTSTPVARTRCVLASTDPVALDYHATKYLLYPNSKSSLHDPDNKKGPLYEYLAECAEEGGGIIDERDVEVRSYDFNKNRFQSVDELVVVGEKEWGTDMKGLMKYVLLRFMGT